MTSFSFKLKDWQAANRSKAGLLFTACQNIFTESASTRIFKSALQVKPLRVYPIYQLTLTRNLLHKDRVYDSMSLWGEYESVKTCIFAYFAQC